MYGPKRTSPSTHAATARPGLAEPSTRRAPAAPTASENELQTATGLSPRKGRTAGGDASVRSLGTTPLRQPAPSAGLPQAGPAQRDPASWQPPHPTVPRQANPGAGAEAFRSPIRFALEALQPSLAAGELGEHHLAAMGPADARPLARTHSARQSEATILKALADEEMSDITDVGQPGGKLLGYLPISFLRDKGITDLDTLQMLFAREGVHSFLSKGGYATPSIYCFSKEGLQRFLDQPANAALLRRTGLVDPLGTVDASHFARRVADTAFDTKEVYAKEAVIGAFLHLPENKRVLDACDWPLDRENYLPGETDAYRFSQLVEFEGDDAMARLAALRKAPPHDTRAQAEIKVLEKLAALIKLVEEPGSTHYDMDHIFNELSKHGRPQAMHEGQRIGDMVQHYKDLRDLVKLIAQAFNDPYFIKDDERIQVERFIGSK